jgi:hypothetical protein
MLRVADRVYVMNGGAILFHGASAEVAGRLGEVERSYLGDGVMRSDDGRGVGGGEGPAGAHR